MKAPLHFYYPSTLGIICVVPRPKLVGYDSLEGQPVAVFYPDTEFEKGRRYPDILGIRECDYEAIKPDIVIFKLGDGSYLAATSGVMEKASRYESRCWLGHMSINPLVRDLTAIAELPQQLDTPVYHF